MRTGSLRDRSYHGISHRFGELSFEGVLIVGYWKILVPDLFRTLYWVLGKTRGTRNTVLWNVTLVRKELDRVKWGTWLVYGPFGLVCGDWGRQANRKGRIMVHYDGEGVCGGGWEGAEGPAES